MLEEGNGIVSFDLIIAKQARPSFPTEPRTHKMPPKSSPARVYPDTPPLSVPDSSKFSSESDVMKTSNSQSALIERASPLAEISKTIRYIEPLDGEFVLYRNSESPGA